MNSNLQTEIERIIAIPDSERRALRAVALMKDMKSQIAQLEDELRFSQELRVIHPETGLPVFSNFLRDLSKKIEYATQEKKTLVVVGVRLDHAYRRISYTRDRHRGFLVNTTVRIRDFIGDNVYQSLSRIEEFWFVLELKKDLKELREDMSKLSELVRHPPESQPDVSFGCVIGFSIFPDLGKTPDDLVEQAEIAMYNAEANLKLYESKRVQPVRRFNTELGDNWRKKHKIEQDLKRATQNGFENFFMVYQPFVNSKGEIKGSEALIRWNHKELGFIPPPQFIGIAERTGHIRMFGRWTLFQSCQALKSLHESGYNDLFVSVNLSPAQFVQPDLVRNILGLLQAVGIDGKFIKLEITEGSIIVNPENAVRVLKELKQNGIRLSIDDFGTGYSSLSYLRKLPIDTLKIDKSFIDDVEHNKEIIKAILSLGKNLGLETLAEGVENKEQKDFLFNEGCDYIQGYYYSKPVKVEVFSEYLNKGGILPQS